MISLANFAFHDSRASDGVGNIAAMEDDFGFGGDLREYWWYFLGDCWS